jgi:hypothetical protein
MLREPFFFAMHRTRERRFDCPGVALQCCFATQASLRPQAMAPAQFSSCSSVSRGVVLIAAHGANYDASFPPLIEQSSPNSVPALRPAELPAVNP